MKTSPVLLLLVCAALVSSSLVAVFALGARDSRAQSQEQWQQAISSISNRLTQMEGEVAALRLSVNRGSNAEAFQRLSRLEQLLRENTGAMETLTFRIGQLQQSSAAYRRDVELRFQILEDDFMALSGRLADDLASLSVRLEEISALAEASVPNQTPEASSSPSAPTSATVSAPTSATASVPAATSATVSTPTAATATASPVPESTFVASAPSATSVTSTPSTTTPAPAAPSAPTGVTPGAAALGTLSSGRDPEISTPGFSGDENVETGDSFAFFEADDFDEPAPEPIDVSGTTGIEEELIDENTPQPLGVIPVDGDLIALNAQAAIPEDPISLYQESFSLLEQSDFDGALEGFQRFAELHPDHDNAAEANYWVGEIHLAQGNYAEAARNFLNVRQTYGDSEHAADSMLKLGVSLRLLEQPERACGVFDELLAPGQFPDLSDTIRRRADLERQLAGC